VSIGKQALAVYGTIFLVVATALAGSGQFSVLDDSQLVWRPTYMNVECEAGPVQTTDELDMSNVAIDRKEGLLNSVAVREHKFTLEGYNTPKADLIMTARSRNRLESHLGDIREYIEYNHPSTDTTDPYTGDYRETAATPYNLGGLLGAEDVQNEVVLSNVWTDRNIRRNGNPTAVRVTDERPGDVPLNDGEIVFKVRYQRYDLKASGGGTPLTISQGSCNVANIQSLVQWEEQGDLQQVADVTTERIENGQLPFGQAISVVTASTPVRDQKNAVDTTGDSVPDKYIISICSADSRDPTCDGQTGATYYPIKEGNEGVLYTDTRTTEFDASIVCHPASPVCSDDGTAFVDTQDKTVSALSGDVDGAVPTGTGEACYYDAGEQTECFDIPSCPGEQVLDQNYQCTAPGGRIAPPPASQGMPVWAWIGASFIATLVIGTMTLGGVFVLRG
jgi:hypothetical protein